MSLRQVFRNQLIIPETDALLPEQSSPIGDQVQLRAGYFMSPRDGRIRVVGGASPAFGSVSGAARTRWDLLRITDTGTLTVQAGVEQAGVEGVDFVTFQGAPGRLDIGGAAIPVGQFPICWVKVTESGAVLISESDITDLRGLVTTQVVTPSVNGDFLADNTAADTGLAGSVRKTVFADHQHAPNVNNDDPENLGTAAPGTSRVYARKDHVHETRHQVPLTAVVATITQATGDPGTATFVDLNTGATNGILDTAELDILWTESVDGGGGEHTYGIGYTKITAKYDSDDNNVKLSIIGNRLSLRQDILASSQGVTNAEATAAVAAAVSPGANLFIADQFAGTLIDKPITVRVDPGRVRFIWGATATWSVASATALSVAMNARATFWRFIAAP